MDEYHIRKENGERTHEMELWNIYFFWFLSWSFLLMRLIFKNKMWFFDNFPFYAWRITSFFALKTLESYLLFLLAANWYFVHERMTYMKGRVIFEVSIWTAIVINHFCFGILFSLYYSLGKNVAFNRNDRFNDVHSIAIIIQPPVHLIAIIASYFLMQELFYISFTFLILNLLSILFVSGK